MVGSVLLHCQRYPLPPPVIRGVHNKAEISVLGACQLQRGTFRGCSSQKNGERPSPDRQRRGTQEIPAAYNETGEGHQLRSAASRPPEHALIDRRWPQISIVRLFFGNAMRARTSRPSVCRRPSEARVTPLRVNPYLITITVLRLLQFPICIRVRLAASLQPRSSTVDG